MRGERKVIACAGNYRSMPVRHESLGRVDRTFEMAFEYPGMHLNVFT